MNTTVVFINVFAFGCLIFAFIRFAFPTLLYLLWFGPVWDWIPNKAPPMYFETWFYGVQRLSGIFSWPNHMAFYFVAFGPLILLSILNKKLIFENFKVYEKYEKLLKEAGAIEVGLSGTGSVIFGVFEGNPPFFAYQILKELLKNEKIFIAKNLE